MLLLATMAASPVCGPAAAPTIAENDIARVYRQKDSAFGCVAGGRTHEVALAARVRDVTLAGRWAAIVGGEPSSALRDLSIVDLRTGGTRVIDGGTFDSVPELAVTTAGRFAWIERTRRNDGRIVDRVRTRGPGEQDHIVTLRTGPLSGLTLAGATVSFTDADGARVGATLPTVASQRIAVTPRAGTVGSRFRLTFVTPPAIGRDVEFVLSSRAEQAERGGWSALCEDVEELGSRPPGRRVVVTWRPGCRGHNGGGVYLFYGQERERCRPTEVPCSGFVLLGGFSFRLR
jgi:hypothetical protein